MVFAIPILLVVAKLAHSADLVMFEEDYCSWCEKWDEEIGVIYDVTPEACIAKLSRLQITDNLPQSMSLDEPIVYTPTFVLIHQNKEQGRITGYPGEDFFWVMLRDLFASLPPDKLKKSSADCQAS